MDKYLKKVVNSQGVEFLDKEKIIITRGHFTKFLCGNLTMLDRMSADILKETKYIHNGKDTFDDYLWSAVKFRLKSEYEAVKGIVCQAVVEDSFNYPQNDNIIKGFTAVEWGESENV